jgi:hypothetical protein
MSNNVQEVQLAPLTGGPGHNWTVGHNGKSGSDPATYPVVSLPAKGGPYLIHFTIQGPNSVKFAADPIAVQAGSKPTGAGLDPQIAAVLPSADGRELFVLDKNDGNGTHLYYKLSFTGHGTLDPIIDNGGGNFTNFSTIELLTAAGALLAVFAIGLYIQKKFRLL